MESQPPPSEAFENTSKGQSTPGHTATPQPEATNANANANNTGFKITLERLDNKLRWTGNIDIVKGIDECHIPGVACTKLQVCGIGTLGSTKFLYTITDLEDKFFRRGYLSTIGYGGVRLSKDGSLKVATWMVVSNEDEYDASVKEAFKLAA
ncbi:hypothetical protein DSL72_008820 [Monilinia vaccinii-corymbosi]|uniref:Uncharacterized protein n=1 Tax=Monilinia vaccinii-corymbosi TaxID=61207 RepID=A0A8A3PSB8_9HELO|nr:hypothetical protein DSL72_008820 [Monilinia vaccinii-corymbosi]